jgi:hypothetical protein
MRFHLGSFAAGLAAYWAFQHFMGVGVTGKGKSAA